MAQTNRKSLAKLKDALASEKEPNRLAKASLVKWEERFIKGNMQIRESEDADRESRFLISQVRQMSGDNHLLCERKLRELSNRIEDVTIDGIYRDEFINRIVVKLRTAADCEQDPVHSAPWADHLADLAWKSRPYQLANFLWQRNTHAAAEWNVDLREVKLHVWGSEDTKTSTVRTIASRLKGFLKGRKFQVKLSVSGPEDAPGYVKTTLPPW